jgi:hypothetical protein
MVDIKKTKEVEDKIRDLINDIEVYNEEEVESEGKEIEDDAAVSLKGKLQEIAKLVGDIK